LRGGDFMHEVQVNVEDSRCAFPFGDHV